MSQAVLKVTPRERGGKGSSRAARRAGLVPAVIYGEKKSPVMVTLRINELRKQIFKGHFMNTVFELEGAGKTERAIPRDVQLDPVTDWPIHIDFLRVAAHAKIEIMLPVHFSNHELAPGLKRGGVLNVVRHEIECLVPTDNIPEQLEVDLTGLEVNDSVHISAIKLPEGVEPVIADRDFTVATIAAPSALRSEGADADDEAAEEAEEEETEEENEDK